MMQEKRRHKRFRLDLMEINGKMIFAHKVEILDISLGGVSLKTDKRLNVGREYLLKLENKGIGIDVKGIIVRCELSDIEEISNEEGVSIYTAGMMFKDPQSSAIENFMNSLEKAEKEAMPAAADRRLNVRFYITTPRETTLRFPDQFKVKVISQSGMLILTEQALEMETLIPMGLSLKEADEPINLIGRVVSCERKEEKGRAHYEIGVEFNELTDKDKTLLKTFTDYLTATEAVGAWTGRRGVDGSDQAK